MSTRPPSPAPVVEAGCRELASAIRNRDITATEVARRHLDRIAALNGSLNAIVHVAPDVLEQAAAADRALERGDRVGPLHGVPFTVKDTLAVAGLPATAGSATLADHVPERTAPVVQRVLDAGGILLGKTNTSEFAVDTHAGNRLFGDTRNPLDPQRTPGGSSGGDSCAVASGMASFGIGTDLGGSIRWPAHCTGVVSFRPTVGRLPGTGALPYDTSAPMGPPNSGSFLHRYMTAGPIARTVADVELLADVMAGPDGYDAAAVPVWVPAASDVELSALRVAWCAGEGTVPVREDVREAVAAAAAGLSGVVDAVTCQRAPRLEEAADLFVRMRDLEGLPEIARIIEGSSASVTPGITSYLGSIESRLAGMTGTRLLEESLSLAARRDAVRAAVLDFMEQWPVLLLPVASVTAPVIGTPHVTIDGQQVPWSALGTVCRAISILSLPVVVVPCGTGEDDLPIGVQVVGRPFHDHEALAVAAALESQWRDLRVPTAAVKGPAR